MPTAPANSRARPASGLLGGTFTPVHDGHLGIARAALELWNLDSVWFVPCSVPPHKPSAGLAPNADRLAMLRLAVAGEPRFDVLPIEFDRPGPSYTLDTVRALRALHPETDFSFIVGADTLPELHTWHRPLELLELVRMVALSRPGHEPAESSILLPPPWPRKLLADLRAGPRFDVASRDVRAAIAARRPVSLVPEPVVRYIQEKHLYQ